MIVTMRQRAGAVLLGLAAFLSLTAAAQGVAFVTREEMREFVWVSIASVGIGAILIGAGLIAWIMQRDRSLQQASIDLVIAATDRLADQIEAAIGALARHNEDPRAHTAASEHNHAPMNKQTARIEEKLDQLLMEHRIIRGSEDEVCALVRMMAKRVPNESQKPKRASDSGDDYTPLRGKP